MPSASAASVPGSERDVLVRLLRRARAVGIDRRRAARRGGAPPRPGPQVDVRAHDVARPRRRSGARATMASGSKPIVAPIGGLVAGRAGARADGAVEQARPERVEEAPVHAGVCRACPCCRRRSTAGSTCGPCAAAIGLRTARADLVERLVPRDALEAAFALPAHAAHRVQQPLGAVHAIEVRFTFAHRKPCVNAVLGVAADRHGAAGFDRPPSSRRCPGSRGGRRP